MYYGWQYQGRAEPVLKPEDGILLSTWFMQASEPAWEPLSPVSEGYTSSSRVLEPTLFTTANLDWLVQHPDPPLDKTNVQEGQSVIARILYAVPFDWSVQHPEPLPVPRAIDEGEFVGLIEPTIYTSQALDWLVQHFNPELGTGWPTAENQSHAILDSGTFFALDWGWLVQHPEPLPIPDLVGEGTWVSVLEPTNFFVTVPFEWNIQNPDQADGLPANVPEGESLSIKEPILLFPLQVQWCVQHPEPLPISWPIGEGVVVAPFTTIIPATGTYTAHGSRFLYTAANWANVVFYFEVYMRATVGSVRARLYGSLDGPVLDSELFASSATSTSFVRIRTSVPVALVDGSEYIAQLQRDSGGVGDAIAAHLIAIGV